MPSERIEDHALSIALKSPNAGLARRLMDGTLLPAERDDLDRCDTIRGAEEQGQTPTQIAPLFGWTIEKFRQYTRSEKYRIYRKFLSEQSSLEEEQQTIDRQRSERRRWDAHGHNALAYYDQAFRRHGEDDPSGKKRYRAGDFVDLDRAERAAQLHAKSQGWTEPVPARTKPRELKAGILQAHMGAIIAADHRETVIRVTETTTIEVGSRETHDMGGEP